MLQNMVRKLIIVFVLGHSKSTLFRTGGVGFTKKVTKGDRGGGNAAKKWCHSLKLFLCPFIVQLNFCCSVYIEALIMLQRATIKHIQEAIGTSDLAILPDPKYYNSTNLPT